VKKSISPSAASVLFFSSFFLCLRVTDCLCGQFDWPLALPFLALPFLAACLFACLPAFFPFTFLPSIFFALFFFRPSQATFELRCFPGLEVLFPALLAPLGLLWLPSRFRHTLRSISLIHSPLLPLLPLLPFSLSPSRDIPSLPLHPLSLSLSPSLTLSLSFFLILCNPLLLSLCSSPSASWPCQLGASPRCMCSMNPTLR